ncbi:sigma-54 interaction domain-containing protein [Spirosoma sp.]|uniref:sigma-54-dependent Fis family transcriptional regulator n=1 Tax=Spirosoma sp. TaxID=1899569 RepID=UPI003B3AFC98
MHTIRGESSTELLQKVASELLTIKRRADLIRIFKTMLQANIGYTQAAIYILDSDTNQLYNLLHTDDLTQEHSVFCPQIQLKELSIAEILMDDSPDLSGFSEFSTEVDRHRSLVEKYLCKPVAKGAMFLTFSLRENNDFIGNLFLLFEDSSSLQPDLVDYLKLLAVTINMAVVHLLAVERQTVLGKNGQLLNLFRISCALTNVRELTDLQRIVQEMILAHFGAASCVVILKSERETSRCLLVAHEPAYFTNANPEGVYGVLFSAFDDCYRKTVNDPRPFLYNLEMLRSLAHKAPLLQAELTSGIVQKVVYPIGFEGGNQGYLFFSYTHQSAIAGLDTPQNRLFLTQFSCVISQLIEQQDVRKRIAQQDMITRLGTLIASVRTNEELLDVIQKNLKDVIGFAYTSISTINDGFMDKVLSSDEPQLFNLESLVYQHPLPEYLKIDYDSGIRQVVKTKFSKAGDAFGFWVLAFDHDREITASTLQLIKDLASQLSVSVQNIMINVKYELREKENNRLIQFSNAIASVQDRHKLAKIIKEHLSELFGIDDFLLWSVTPDFHYRSPVLFDQTSWLRSHPCFQTNTEAQFRNADGIHDTLIDRNGVSYFSEEALKSAYPDNRYFVREETDNQLIDLGGSVLRVGNEVVGILTFFTRRSDLVREKEDLFLSICSQLAIMASNRITTDRISEQLAEIKRYNERLDDEKIHLLNELELPAHKSDMIGSSVGIQTVFRLIQQVAYTESTVLILGETGTGKELVARSVHDNSPRKSKLMVKVNCAALPANLVESELFGHEKGSFTGALEKRIGKFELANQGTLFLDEIGEMPLELQGKLLRVLQEKEIERVGGKASIKVDVRVIVATNRNLEKEVALGNFRSDLYYRINIFPIRLPPLRDRIADVSLLANHFITKYAAKAGKEIKSLNSSVLREMQRYHWPGNIRELEHTIERSVLLTRGDTLKMVDIPKTTPALDERSIYSDKKIMTLYESERAHIMHIIKLCRGKIHGQNGAATLLGIPPSTLNSKMKKLNLGKQDIRF